MWIIGLTGAIGAGKSRVSACFRQEGVPVHCSDRYIHFLLENDHEVQHQIHSLWPEVFVNGQINRILLGDRVFSSPDGLNPLESFLYPKLVEDQKKFLQHHQFLKSPFVVLDVPLLLEVGLDAYCDSVVVVSASASLRKHRVVKRNGMTARRLQAIECLQMKEGTRRKKADFIIYTGLDKGNALKAVKQILYFLSQQPPLKWQGIWPKNLHRRPHESRNCFRHRNNRA